mmetsp:Transcript_12693/g.16528  ORF Transcript_12693/g.16528 Transcript_12693/m.16528 type:complete len:309 (-) Transcript_12693:241-1167(-)
MWPSVVSLTFHRSAPIWSMTSSITPCMSRDMDSSGTMRTRRGSVTTERRFCNAVPWNHTARSLRWMFPRATSLAFSSRSYFAPRRRMPSFKSDTMRSTGSRIGIRNVAFVSLSRSKFMMVRASCTEVRVGHPFNMCVCSIPCPACQIRKQIELERHMFKGPHNTLLTFPPRWGAGADVSIFGRLHPSPMRHAAARLLPHSQMLQILHGTGINDALVRRPLRVHRARIPVRPARSPCQRVVQRRRPGLLPGPEVHLAARSPSPGGGAVVLRLPSQSDFGIGAGIGVWIVGMDCGCGCGCGDDRDVAGAE